MFFAERARSSYKSTTTSLKSDHNSKSDLVCVKKSHFYYVLMNKMFYN